MAHVLLVGIGGFIGAIARFLIGQHLPLKISSSTLLINLVGSFAIGLLMHVIQSRYHPSLYHFLIPGLLGGFTTYSAFSSETVAMLEKQLFVPALIYVLLTVIGGIVACGFGFYLSKLIPAT